MDTNSKKQQNKTKGMRDDPSSLSLSLFLSLSLGSPEKKGEKKKGQSLLVPDRSRMVTFHFFLSY